MVVRIAKKLVLNQATCKAGEVSANDAMHLCRHQSTSDNHPYALRPGDGNRWTASAEHDLRSLCKRIRQWCIHGDAPMAVVAAERS